MVLLILGVLVWSGVHFIPSLGATQRAAVIGRIGEGPYKGLFALSLVGAVTLMTLGWRGSEPVAAFSPPAWGRGFAHAAMLVSLVLFMGSNVPTNIKRYIRHPQLTGVAIWALAHLLANGDLRAVVLFGGLGLWAIAEMVCINRRDGAWLKPEPLPLVAEVKPLVAGVVAYALMIFAHPYIAGMPIYAG